MRGPRTGWRCQAVGGADVAVVCWVLWGTLNGNLATPYAGRAHTRLGTAQQVRHQTHCYELACVTV